MADTRVCRFCGGIGYREYFDADDNYYSSDCRPCLGTGQEDEPFFRDALDGKKNKGEN
jgi:hypothetical protein